MEQKMTTISGKNFTSIETGSMNEWKEKVFLKDVYQCNSYRDFYLDFTTQ